MHSHTCSDDVKGLKISAWRVCNESRQRGHDDKYVCKFENINHNDSFSRFISESNSFPHFSILPKE